MCRGPGGAVVQDAGCASQDIFIIDVLAGEVRHILKT
jgi:hypothetical protein